ncbi:MAG TPA: glycerophosphodiester phosphodiesterase [Candidatus Lokiarchaeia archaeon]|nr:glycerophosphodiester phosphodiesterase [Candidatus Lokiarchaeia archaeon]
MDAKIHKRPFIWAHRGASGYEKENTLPAFRLAMEIGADGIEMDTFITKDGDLLINHEGAVKLDGVKVAIPSFSLPEIRATTAGENMPTFTEVLGEFQPQNVPISIDVRDISTARKLLAVLEEREAFHLVEVCVDVPQYAAKVRKLSDDVILVFSPAIGWPLRETPALLRKYLPLFLETRVKAVNFQWKYYQSNQELGSFLHANGLLTYAWDVHLQKVMKAVVSLECDAIYTNYPDRFREIRDASIQAN